MAKSSEAPPEADRFEEAPHPRDSYAFFGHAAEERLLLDAYRTGRLPQAILIGGPVGIGKATLAWRLARFLFAHPDPASAAVRAAESLHVPPEHPAARRLAAGGQGDLALLRRAWNEKTKRHFTEIRAEDVRRVVQLFQQAAGAGGYRICILDSADDLNRAGANALLKLIEEPPPRSLFLIVAQRPGQVLATVRSRCRILPLKPLEPEQVFEAVMALGPPWDEDAAEVRAAAAAAQGSVREALRRIDGGDRELDASLANLLDRLPDVDWRAVHALADRVAGRDSGEALETLLGSVYDWLGQRVRQGAARAEPSRRLAPYAEVWEKVAARAQENEALNLDRRQLVLAVFTDLAAAADGSPT
jgi:DNA polymerase-3 subunit delta'